MRISEDNTGGEAGSRGTAGPGLDQAEQTCFKNQWPVNECRMKVLVDGGKTDAEIAAKFGVTTQAVAKLRESYAL